MTYDVVCPVDDQAGHPGDLEWLYIATTELDAEPDKIAALERLLEATTRRMDASFGALTIPERNIRLRHAAGCAEDDGSAQAYRHAHTYVMGYVQRRRAALVANRPPADSPSTPCKLLAVPVHGPHRKPIGALAFTKPASQADFERRELYVAKHAARLMQTCLEAGYDTLTGLLTRTALERQGLRLMAVCEPDRPHSLIYLDIDDLHVINEAFGFACGDRAVTDIGRLLRPPYLSEEALAGRIAGGCFAVLIPDCHPVQALQRAQALQSEIGKLAVGSPQPMMLSASCGVAGIPRGGDAFSRALIAAELACRAARERGRSRSDVYLDVEDGAIRRRDDILSVVRLRTALESDSLQIFAQRIVPLADLRQTSGIECLVRLVAEDGSMVEPAQFFDAAQRYQLARAVDEWMIDRTLVLLQPFAELLFNGGIRVAFNLSEQSLCEDGFVGFLEERLASCEIAPGLIVCEIAESALLRHPTRIRAVARCLKALGCCVALDNFGTTPASLTQLEDTLPDIIKLDGRTVSDGLADEDTRQTVRTLAARAAALQIECIAAHASSPTAMHRLRALGIRLAQGNHLHRPAPLGQVMDALREEEQRQLEQLYQPP